MINSKLSTTDAETLYAPVAGAATITTVGALTSGSIGGIKMESNKVFTGTGTHGNSNTGFFADSSGNFSLGSKFKFTNSTGELRVTGSNVILETPSFFLGATGSAFISGSVGNIQISSSNLHARETN